MCNIEGDTLDQKYDRIRAIINSKGIDHYVNELQPKFSGLVIPEIKTRGAFTHNNELYYANDCSLVQCLGFK